jgi:hypothetical protein
MKNEIVVSFGIFDFNDITHAEITQSLGINPVKFYVKGEKKNPKNPDSPLITSNSWIMGSGLDKYRSFEEQMTAIISVIESKIEIFRPFCSTYFCEFSCALFIFNPEESTPWVHLNSRYNKLIKELNIEFDLDLYVFPKSDS